LRLLLESNSQFGFWEVTGNVS